VVTGEAKVGCCRACQRAQVTCNKPAQLGAHLACISGRPTNSCPLCWLHPTAPHSASPARYLSQRLHTCGQTMHGGAHNEAPHSCVVVADLKALAGSLGRHYTTREMLECCSTASACHASHRTSRPSGVLCSATLFSISHARDYQ
jgi:hypothetical protein